MTSDKQHFPSLAGRSIIVTGGGRGLGKAMTLALAESGAHVMATAAHSLNELETVQSEASKNGRVEIVQADAASYSDCEKVVAATIAAFGSVHSLVNNAGRGMRLVSETFTTKPCLFWETPPEHWKTIVECNINGPFNMARAITPILVDEGVGKIINISTSLQTMIRTGYSPYGPSKAALEAASRVWAADLADSGVTVNVLLPGGATDTALLPDMANKRGADGQLLSPDLMRAPIRWLCADESNAHTGQRFIAKNWLPDTGYQEAVLAARDPVGNTPNIM